MSNQELAVKKADLPAIAQERGIEPHQWNALKEAVWTGASDGMVALAFDYCRARNLDPVKKPVHIVETWDSKQGKMVETIWPSIGELRTTAMRTGRYAGKDEAVFGPDETKKFGDFQMTVPAWCQVTVYRMVEGEARAFHGERVFWEEAYAKTKKGPNSMWRKRPRGQIAKCAEASALRIAFPEEIGSHQTAEEMAGQTINADYDGGEGEPEPKPARPAPPPKGGVAAAKAEGKSETAKKTATKKAAAKQEPEKAEPVDGEYTDIPEGQANEEKPAERPAPPPKTERPAEKPAEKAEHKEPIIEVATGETHEGLTVEITKFAKTKANGRDLIMLATTGDLKASPVYAWADTVDADVLAQGNTAVVSVAGLQQSGKGKPAIFITAAEAHVNF